MLSAERLSGIAGNVCVLILLAFVLLPIAGCNYSNYSQRDQDKGELLELPGKIQAENYYLSGSDSGGPVSNGGDSLEAVSGDGVAISRDGGGFSVEFKEGDWSAYRVDITEGGTYRLSSRVAVLASEKGRFRIKVGDTYVTDPVEFGPSTRDGSGVKKWQYVEMNNIKLPSGIRELRIVAEQGDFGIDYLEFIPEKLQEDPPGSVVVDEPTPANDSEQEPDIQHRFSPRINEVGTISNISSNRNMFSTALAYYEGSIYTVNVERGSGKDGLVTVVRKGTQDLSGEWSWESHIIDDDTIDNDYHTQASIAIDKLGYIHVAYNMHNMPWQYSVSARPGNISEFVFRGDRITPSQRDAVRRQITSFPSLGTAAIPGNQVTYPAFFYDRDGELYVTYRFATRPKRSFGDRGFAGGIARYDVDTGLWEALGGEVTVTSDDADIPGGEESARIRAFAYTDDWSVYQIWLSFDDQNNMHVSWLWREGGAGPYPGYPSYAFSADGGASFSDSKGVEYRLPISVHQAELFIADGDRRRYGDRTSIALDLDGIPYIYSSEKGDEKMYRKLVHRSSAGWSAGEDLPEGATEVVIDEEGRFWAFATGPKIFLRNGAGEEWEDIFRQEGRYGFIRTLKVPGERKIFLYSMDDWAGKVKIHMITY